MNTKGKRWRWTGATLFRMRKKKKNPFTCARFIKNFPMKCFSIDWFHTTVDREHFFFLFFSHTRTFNTFALYTDDTTGRNNPTRNPPSLFHPISSCVCSFIFLHTGKRAVPTTANRCRNVVYSKKKRSRVRIIPENIHHPVLALALAAAIAPLIITSVFFL